MPNLSNAAAMKRAELSLQILTAILITFAAGFVLIQLSARYGATVANFDAQTF